MKDEDVCKLNKFFLVFKTDEYFIVFKIDVGLFILGAFLSPLFWYIKLHK